MSEKLQTSLKTFLTSIKEITDNDTLCRAYVDFFNNAETSIRMTVCEFETPIFRNEMVINAIRQALKRDDRALTIEILLGPQPLTPDVSRLAEFTTAPNFTLWQMAQPPNKHVLVADARDVMMVSLHRLKEIRGIVLGNEPNFAARVMRDLERETAIAHTIN